MSETNGAIRKGFEITGRVQGVGFRWWSRKTAESLGLRGTVRNRPDGSVELHVEGPARDVREMEDRLSRGPRAAEVAELREISSEEELPEGFRILR